MQKDDDEYTSAELEAMLTESNPASMTKLGTSEDWIVTAKCPHCEDFHHYLVTPSLNKRKKRPFDCFELALGTAPPHGDLELLENENGGIKTFVSVDEAAEYIEELLEDDDEDDDG